MGQIAMFPNPIERLFGFMSGLIGILQTFAVIAGVILFISNMMDIFDMFKGQQIDVGELIITFFISVIIIGIGVSGPDLIKKMLDQKNSQPTATEQKVEKEKELSGEEKLKKLNAYRKSNNKDILLADTSVAEQYLSYLKGKNLDETALK